MAVHSKDEVLLYKIFPSSLGPVAIRWFNGLRANSIYSFRELTQAFGSRFVTCSRVPRPLDSLLSLSMREGETLKAYSDRYWEMYNEIKELRVLEKIKNEPFFKWPNKMVRNPARRNLSLYCQYH